jgi:class 3 adenylate cyclase
LHLGQVIYGNVGVPGRLQFTVVGAAVNEVVRVQDLTKPLGCPLLATATFADAVAGPWRPLGSIGCAAPRDPDADPDHAAGWFSSVIWETKTGAARQD